VLIRYRQNDAWEILMETSRCWSGQQRERGRTWCCWCTAQAKRSGGTCSFNPR